MKKLEDNVGKTRYILGYSVQATNTADTILQVFQHKKDVMQYLKKGVVANLGDISLIHGTLTRAVSVPNKLHDNIDIFLIIPQANEELDSFIIQCADMDYLRLVVTAMITQTTEYCEELDNIIDDISDLDEQVIDNLFVLYGYEIELKYTFDSDGIDDEIVEEAKKIYEKIKAEQ